MDRREEWRNKENGAQEDFILYSVFCHMITNYDSTTSRTPAGQAFAQIPQAIHLLLVEEDSALTITPKGQASTHLPQPVHFFLLIM